MSSVLPQHVCEECDLASAELEHADACPRCGASLRNQVLSEAGPTLALAITALVFMITANTYPIVSLDVKGQIIEASIFDIVQQMWNEDRPVTAMLIAATTTFIPLAELLALIALLCTQGKAKTLKVRAALLRVLKDIQSWSMVDVFVLGTLVSLVKLSHLAYVDMKIGFVFLLLLMLCTSAVNRKIQRHPMLATR